MLRLVRSALRTADRFVHVPSSGVRLKPLGNILQALKGSSVAAQNHSLSTSSHSINLSSYGHRAPPISTSFSLPTRIALGRPLGLSAPHLPRPPMVPRSMTQVGLGTARNFSSTRQVFQNLVDNVPISTRALWEADWDVKKRKKENRKMAKKEKPAKSVKIADKAKAINASTALPPRTESVCTVNAKEASVAMFSDYFTVPEPRVKGITTTFTVPLYPSVAERERAPLPPSSDGSRLLPLSEIREIHDVFSLHQIRVSSLFRRLDAADIWSKGATCEQYGPPGPLITTLQVVFNGWTKEMVLEAVGEAGMGWCELTETRDLEPELQQTNPLSFVIPTLDFSSSFAAQTGIADPVLLEHLADWTSFTTRTSSPILESANASDDGFDSDGWASSIGDYQPPPPHDSTPIGRSLGFSFEFLSRSASTNANDLFEPF